MVNKHLSSIKKSSGEVMDSVGIAIEKLRKKNFREIRTRSEIKKICHEVISDVDRLLLVRVNESEIQKRKIKKGDNTPIRHDDTKHWIDVVNIRNDWNTEGWLNNPPHGWVYYSEDKSILGTIYEGSSKGHYEVFIRREVAENPEGAMLLIKAMKKKLEGLIPNDGSK